MFFFVSIYIVGFLASLIHLYLLPDDGLTWFRIIEILLLYQIVFSIGITSLVAFFGLTFMSKHVAKITDWPESPFEQQLANVNLAFAVLGIMGIYLRGHFWTATILGFSIWIFSDGIHHLYHAWKNHNYSSGNIGVPLWTDLLIPPVLLILLYFYLQGSI